MSREKKVLVIGTGTIGEPLIGLLSAYREPLGLDEVIFHKRTPLLTDRSKVQDLVWEHADTVVWLDLPRRVVFPALILRTLRRGLGAQTLWNGNVERPFQLLLPRAEDNILLWAIRHFPVYRERYQAAISDPSWSRLQFVRLRSRTEVTRFLSRIEASPEE